MDLLGASERASDPPQSTYQEVSNTLILTPFKVVVQRLACPFCAMYPWSMRHTTQIKVSGLTRYETSITSTYGDPPLNIFKHLRQDHNLTLEELSSLCNLSTKALVRLEQGCYEEPLQGAVDFWLKQVVTSELRLTDSYAEFQTLTRARYHQMFGPQLNPSGFSKFHPLKQLKLNHDQVAYGAEAPSTLSVARMMCLPQPTLAFWESNWRSQQSVPKQFQTVLMEMGYTKQDVINVVEAYNQWRKIQLSNNKVRTG